MGRAWGPCPRQDGEEASDWELSPSPQPSQVTQMVKSLPAVWETQVGSLGQEGPLKEEMATHSSVLAWKIPWMEEPGGLQSMGLGFATEPVVDARPLPLLGRCSTIVSVSPTPASSCHGGAGKWVWGSCSFSKLTWLSREGSVMSRPEGEDVG